MPTMLIWPWVVAGGLLLAGLAWWLWRRRRQRPVEAEAVPSAPPRPAHELAYEELQKLLSSGLLEKGGLKEFYIELAEILKRYLEGRFGIDTFERTSNEILRALRLKRTSVKVKATAVEFFVACDLVKFARYHPDPPETKATVGLAYRLIDETKPEPAPRSELLEGATIADGRPAEGGSLG